MDTSNSAGSADSAEKSFILLNQIVRLVVSLVHTIYRPDAKTCPLVVKHVSKFSIFQGDHVDTSNFAGSSDIAEESFILLNQVVWTGCVPCTLNMLHWRENVSVGCQTCLIKCPLSRRPRGYFKIWSGVRWRREPAWKRQLAVLVPAPTTDLGLADPILSLLEVLTLFLVSCS